MVSKLPKWRFFLGSVSPPTPPIDNALTQSLTRFFLISGGTGTSKYKVWWFPNIVSGWIHGCHSEASVRQNPPKRPTKTGGITTKISRIIGICQCMREISSHWATCSPFYPEIESKLYKYFVWINPGVVMLTFCAEWHFLAYTELQIRKLMIALKVIRNYMMISFLTLLPKII